MQLKRILLASFGHFEGASVDDIRPGLVVIHGPNEAGKTTVRSAIRWVLFGTQRGDRARWQGRDGRLAAALVLGDVGSEDLTVSRTGLRNGSSVEVRTPRGPALDESALHTALGGTDLALHDAILSFDSFELQEASSLRGERLQTHLAVGAVAGKGRHPADIIASYDKEAASLWRPRGACTIRTLSATLKEARTSLASAQRDAEAYEVQGTEVGDLSRALEGLLAAENRTAAESRALTQRIAAWPHWDERAALMATHGLEERDETADGAEDEARRARGAVADALAEVERRESAYREAEDARIGVEAKLRTTIVDNVIRAESARIRALAAEVPHQRARDAETVEAAAEVERLDAIASRAAAALIPHVAAAELRTIATGPAVAAEVRRHATVTARLLADAGPALASSEAEMREVERLEGLLAAECAALASDVEAEAEPLTPEPETVPANGTNTSVAAGRDTTVPPADIGPHLDDAALDALETWRHDWAVAEARAEEALSAARVARVRATEAVSRAQTSLSTAMIPGDEETPDDASLNAVGHRLSDGTNLVRRREALITTLTELQREAANANDALPIDATMASRIDASEQARYRVRTAFEARDRAARRVEQLGADERPGRTPAAGPNPADAEARREALIRARSAIDVHHARLDRGPQGAQSARFSWAALLSVVVALVAVVLKAFIVAAVAAVAAVVQWWLEGRRAQAGAAPDASRDAVVRALAAASLPRDASRADVEIALAQADEAAKEAHARADADHAAARMRALRDEAAANLVAAQQTVDAALTACGIPVPADAALADAWFDAARASARRRIAEDAVSDELQDLDAAWRKLALDVTGVLGGDPARFDLVEATATLERLRGKVAEREALRAKAEAIHAASITALADADATLTAIAATPAIPSPMASAWRTFATQRGLPTGPPTHALVARAKRTRALMTRRSSLDSARLALAARRAEAERALAVAKGQADAARAALDSFDAFKRSLGAPAQIAPIDAEGWYDAIVEAKRADAAHTAATDRVARLAAASTDFLNEVRALAEATAYAAPVTSLADAEPCLTALTQRLDDANAAATRLIERREQAEASRLVAETRRGEVDTARHALAKALERANCEDLGAWRDAVQRDAIRVSARRDITLLEAELRGGLGPDWHARMTEAVANYGDIDAAEASAARLAQTRRTLAAERESLEQRQAELRLTMKALETSTEVAARAAVVAATETSLAAATRTYWRICLARRLLAETFERYRRQRQPAVIQTASRWFAIATKGAYQGIESDDTDGMRFSVIAADGHRHDAEALSTGTTALLYLAIRLALAADLTQRSAAQPLIVDDVLAHLDPERAEGAARLLFEAATANDGQVIVFTCRPETVATIARVAPAAQQIPLPRWAGRTAPAPRHGAALVTGATSNHSLPLPLTSSLRSQDP